MSREIIVFWRHANGTRCVVTKPQQRGWQLMVMQGDAILLVEAFEDPLELLARAEVLRPLFASAVA